MSGPALRERLADRFRSLGHRNFRLYWSGQLVSLVGTWMQSVAQGWLMHRLTDSAFMLGLLGFMQFLPVLMFSLWAGVVADRLDKRRLLYLTQGAALLQAAALAVVVMTGVVRPWMVLVLAFVFGIINAFDLPVRQSFLIEMVVKEDLPNAIALNSAAFNTARIIGPAIAGVLVATIGEGGCFALNAVSYLAVLYCLKLMRLPPRLAHAEGASRRVTLREGVAYAIAEGPIRNLLLLLGLTAGLGFQYMVLLPVYASHILHGGPGAYGLMVSAFGIGALLAAVRLTQDLDRWGLRRNLLAGLLLSGVGLAVFAWSRSLALTLPMGLIAGLGLIVYVASVNTLLQLRTEDRFRGRVMSLYTLMFVGTAPIGALASGAIAERWSAPVATTFNAAVLLAGAVWVAYRLRIMAARERARPADQPQVERIG
ncbi:MAG TPA: MFS transporter [Candidatus Eisenbacteria bacterium]